MTEEKIERWVEAATDRLDAAFGPGQPMTQQEYDAKIAEIDAWAERQRRWVTVPGGR